MTAADCLKKAKQLIEEKGWCQGNLRKLNGEGEHCMAGAMLDANLSYSPTVDRAYEVLYQVVGGVASGGPRPWGATSRRCPRISP
jgi:hypothetical protein